jgi:hypothetical protein
MLKQAHLVRDLGKTPLGVREKLYRLSDRIVSETGYVVVAAGETIWGSATFIFLADASGEVLDYSPMEGSIVGVVNHERALEAAGYQLAEGELLYEAPDLRDKPEQIPILEPGFVLDPEPEDK